MHNDVMTELKASLQQIMQVLPAGEPIVYLDIPIHDNAGDLLIHKGAETFFRYNNVNVLHQLSVHDLCRRKDRNDHSLVWKRTIGFLDQVILEKEPVIVLHGGGNVGDLYPEFQKFRERIIKRYPNTKIVILPQSVHFVDTEARQEAVDTFGGHDDLTLIVRDEASLEFVDECGLARVVLPDMAHALWGQLPQLRSKRSAQPNTLRQRRRDLESRHVQPEAAFDWVDLKYPRERLLFQAVRKLQGVDMPFWREEPRQTLWWAYRDSLIRRAVRTFDRYERIDTDRLHGVILGALMAREVRYGEGSYGKLGRYVSKWLQGSPLLSSANVHV